MSEAAPATGTAVATAEAAPPPVKSMLTAEAGDVLAIVPKDLDQAWRYAAMVVKAGLAPSSYDNDPQKVVIGILAGLELGVAPMQALKGIAIINNRPSVWGDLAVALIQSKGAVSNSEQSYTGKPGEDDYTANYLIWRKGQENPYEGHFSIGNAKRAQLWGNAKKRPWIEYPERMLMMRARAFALRDGFSDCLCGLAIAEEAQDMPPPAPEPVRASEFLDDEIPEGGAEVVPGPGAGTVAAK
jgi:hypothetical protein